MRNNRDRFAVLVCLALFGCLTTLAFPGVPLYAQLLPATGGFVEPATSTAVRPLISTAEAAALLPPRGMFTFPAPYHTTAFRLTNGDDCGGRDCVKPVGYSYWGNINNHAGSNTMLVFLSLERIRGGAGPSLFSIDKQTGATRNLGPLFPSTSAWSWANGEGWYFSHTRPNALYVFSGPALHRFDVQARTFERVFDITARFGTNRYIWQPHSSGDDRVHSATLRDSATYAELGCIAYQEATQQFLYVPRIGDYDECQVDKSGRWLIIKENVDGRNGEDNRIIDLQTGTERVLLDENGAGGHSDVGYGYMVAMDNWNPTPGAVRVWRFDRDVRGGQPTASTPGQGTLVYRLANWSGGVGHIAHGNARPDLAPEQQRVCSSNASRYVQPRVNEVVCYKLDGSLETLVVAPNLSNLDAAGGRSEYEKLPKGNLDPTGEYFIWTANAGTSRLDAFIVRVPPGASSTSTPPPPPPPPAPTGVESVRWTARVNVTATGGSLQKTSGCTGCQDAGAISEQQIASGNGALLFTASETTTNRIIGLSTGNSGTLQGEIRHGIRLQASGIAEIRESGVYRKDTRFVTGDTFEIRVEQGQVRYYKNGTLIYTSLSVPRYPLLVDSALSTVGATLSDARLRIGS